MPQFYFFIQIRMRSSRLPGKVMMPVLQDLKLVDLVYYRVKESKFYKNENIYFLTSDKIVDDPLIDYFKEKSWHYFRGEEENVFKRFYRLTQELQPDYFFRICADNPFMEPRLLDELGGSVSRSPESDYVSFADPNGTPVIRTHYGYFGELVSGKTFLQVSPGHLTAFQREHVTPIFYSNPGRYRIKLLDMPKSLVDENIRLTIDTIEDLEIARKIFAKVDRNADISRVYQSVYSSPDLLKKMTEQINLNKKV